MYVDIYSRHHSTMFSPGFLYNFHHLKALSWNHLSSSSGRDDSRLPLRMLNNFTKCFNIFISQFNSIFEKHVRIICAVLHFNSLQFSQENPLREQGIRVGSEWIERNRSYLSQVERILVITIIDQQLRRSFLHLTAFLFTMSLPF